MIGGQRRLVVGVVGGLLMIGVLGACGGSDDKSSATTTTTAPTTTLTEAQNKEAITTVFTEFFDGKNTNLDAKLQKLDDPDKYKALYNKFATDATTGPQLAGTSVTVTNIDLKPDGTAEVTYTLNLNGTPALDEPTRHGGAGRGRVARGRHDVLRPRRARQPRRCARPRLRLTRHSQPSNLGSPWPL